MRGNSNPAQLTAKSVPFFHQTRKFAELLEKGLRIDVALTLVIGVIGFVDRLTQLKLAGGNQVAQLDNAA